MTGISTASKKARGILLVASALAVSSALSYFLVFAPKFREVKRLQAELIVAEADMGKALEVWGEMSHTSRADIDRLEGIVLTWRDKVPVSPDAGTLLEEFGRQAVRQNLRALRISVPEKTDPGGGSTVSGPGGGEKEAEEKTPGEIRFRVAFFSTYKEMAAFLDGVPRMKRLLSIRNLEVSEKEGEMETTLELSAFYRSRR
ncbi:MAG TPA: hypothetical protein DD658_00920 [Deltaproteobacteria bacterium]|nr:MAG: hypothetical protein A2X88_02940 [Deltaproteobacteria bacterium GWC2_65_14]HBO68782.1 hypothetical protein [Deltaproteobacteria bacterium]